MIKRIIRLLSDPKRIIYTILLKCFRSFLSDKQYLKLMYYLQMGYELDLNNPKTFNAKLNWLKLYDRNPIYHKMVDKYTAKEYVTERIGEKYIIPTLCVWDRPEDINYDELPNAFVLKTTHGGGNNGVILCENKNSFDKLSANKTLNIALKSDLYQKFKEWVYKDLPKRIIAEQMLTCRGGVNDYKFFCFNGIARFWKIDFDRNILHRANYYDRYGNILQFGELHCPPDFDRTIEIPANLNEMIILAEKLSEGIPFLRVDFYNINNEIKFGEMTFYPAAGFGKFTHSEWDEKLGDMLILRILEKQT